MSIKERSIKRKSGQVLELPSTTDDNVADYIINVVKKFDSDDGSFVETEYGHALAASTVGLISVAEVRPQDQQKELKKQVEKLIKVFGPNIVHHLREDLKGAIDDEIEEILKKNSNPPILAN